MRLLIVAAATASVIGFIPGALAQNGRPPAAAPGLSEGDAEHQHPQWYKEPSRYKPCPASVVFPNGQHACIGLP
jgi:hypothetical protein